MRRCQWCRDSIPMVDADGTAYVVCALTPPTHITVQSVKDGQVHTDVKWVRPPMNLLGWCGQFKLSLWKLLFSRGSRT